MSEQIKTQQNQENPEASKWDVSLEDLDAGRIADPEKAHVMALAGNNGETALVDGTLTDEKSIDDVRRRIDAIYAQTSDRYDHTEASVNALQDIQFGENTAGAVGQQRVESAQRNFAAGNLEIASMNALDAQTLQGHSQR